MLSSITVSVLTTIVTLVVVYFGRLMVGPRINAFYIHNEFGKVHAVEIMEIKTRHPVMGFDKDGFTQYSEQLVSREKKETFYVRLAVTKKGIGTLKGCRAFLVDITVEANGRTERVYWDSIPLCWSYLLEGKQEVDIPSNVRMNLDLFSTQKGSDCIFPRFVSFPNHYQFNKMGKYQMVVLISAENAMVQKIGIEFDWNGQWDEVEIKQFDC